MVCPKCGKEGIDPGDAFCRYCGFSLATPASAPQGAPGVAEKKSVTARDTDAGKGLQILGGAIFVVVALLAPGVAVLTGLSNFHASVLPWLATSLMLVGLALAFIGTRLRHAR